MLPCRGKAWLPSPPSIASHRPVIRIGTNITVVDDARPSEFCSERTGLGLGGGGASSTSVAPRPTGGLLATTAPQRSGALRPRSPSGADGNGRPKPATFFKSRHRRPRGARAGKEPGARQGQERQGHHGQRHVSMPPHPGAHFVLIQADLGFFAYPRKKVQFRITPPKRPRFRSGFRPIPERFRPH